MRQDRTSVFGLDMKPEPLTGNADLAMRGRGKAVRQISANQSMIGSPMSGRVNTFIDSPKRGGFV